jgi:phosphoglycolate phosphatase-like HAD superfamily hydrolase
MPILNVGMNRRGDVRAALLAVLLSVGIGGCVVEETRPQPKVHPIQATAEIPESELLDVGVRVFDPGIPPEVENDAELQQKKGIYPDVRKAEARYMAMQLRNTLESSAQWGAVRVTPANAEFVDVIVSGRIIESSGKELKLEISVRDSTGRAWFTDRKYESQADIGSYLSDAALKARDPFQNVYSTIANDILAFRKTLASEDLRTVRTVTELRFAQDLAPAAFSGHVAQNAEGRFEVQRLPAEGDPLYERVSRIRDRDGALIDTVSDYYGSFAEAVKEPYGDWRRYSFDEIAKEEKLKQQARTRMILGAAAVLGSILVSSQCSGGDYDCQRIEDAARTAATIGGIAGIVSGLKKGADAKIHTAAIQELATSFNADVASQVVEVEGRTLKLTGTAEEQYREWRELLKQMYLDETGGANNTAVAADTSTDPTTPR